MIWRRSPHRRPAEDGCLSEEIVASYSFPRLADHSFPGVETRQVRIEAQMAQLEGSVLVLILYDVCEEIRLDELRKILGVLPPGREPSFKHPAPEYVRFERPPVVGPLNEIRLETGESATGRLKYYDYGVVSVEFQ